VDMIRWRACVVAAWREIRPEAKKQETTKDTLKRMRGDAKNG